MVDAKSNGNEGVAYGAMINRCGLQSASVAADGTAVDGSRFLVVPMPVSGVSASFYYCGS